ncbi:MAG TPA: glycosyltransferase family 2 protein [Rhodanobacteraceae bacterium]|nr:glycosyltransferase family 2 protein [Rhodanobacteraceae bacterium]
MGESAPQGLPPACAVHVCAVLVTYHPDLAILAESLDALLPQVGCVVVVDNASGDPRVATLCAARAIDCVALPINRGLAWALNEGIARARGVAGVTRVLLLDQDSVAAPAMVARLDAVLTRLAADGVKAGAVGPCYRDPREARAAPFVRIRFPFNRKLRCAAAAAKIRCDFLITSGCLIPLAVLDEVGAMDAALFIDNVDLEWCFRAASRGYVFHGVCAAALRHRLGDARRRLFGLPRGIVVHPPARLYYMMRNRVLLYRRAYVPRRWIAQDLPRLVVKLLLFGVLIAPRRRNLRCMLAGLAAGLAGRPTPPPEGA